MWGCLRRAAWTRPAPDTSWYTLQPVPLPTTPAPSCLLLRTKHADRQCVGLRQIRDIGSGNFGVAKLMRDKQTSEMVAVKFIERGEKV